MLPTSPQPPFSTPEQPQQPGQPEPIVTAPSTISPWVWVGAALGLVGLTLSAVMLIRSLDTGGKADIAATPSITQPAESASPESSAEPTADVVTFAMDESEAWNTIFPPMDQAYTAFLERRDTSTIQELSRWYTGQEDLQNLKFTYVYGVAIVDAYSAIRFARINEGTEEEHAAYLEEWSQRLIDLEQLFLSHQDLDVTYGFVDDDGVEQVWYGTPGLERDPGFTPPDPLFVR